MKRQNDTEQTYNYCERCLKPIRPVDHDSYSFCSECAYILLHKIFGEEKGPEGD